MWPQAFRRQAHADFKLLRRLEALEPLPARCHLLLLLQMATEKLAKSYLAEDDQPPAPTHMAFVRLLQLTKRRRDLRRALGFRDYAAMIAGVDGLLPTARLIEQLAPASGAGANVEYPFVDANGEVIAPVDHDFPNLSPRDPRFLKLRRLVEVLMLLD